MKPYSKIPIQDCGEPLVPIALENICLEDPAPYVFLGADYQGKSPYCLRTGVLTALAQAQDNLSQCQPGWKIKVFDAYRPIAVQQFMVDYTFGQILARDKLTLEQLSEAQRQQILEEVYQIWAIPSHDPATPPPHSTGAALDITLINELGQAVAMGGEIDELSPRSQPNFYQQATDQEAQIYHYHRCLLNDLMESVGFLRHPGEWWHFSLGDQLWAWQYNQRNAIAHRIAHYGRVE
ncbi:MAG: M15 family metallopeptidase [Snowella sp.]|nr:M15 family metallopeptidase [Snowella sp.]